jgi:eukaryotic-like serine/threonine-protein kinase
VSSGNGNATPARKRVEPRFGGRSISALIAEIARAPEVDVADVLERLRPGSVVEKRFEIVREIGRGGFGAVYEAKDLTLERTVALKIVTGGQRGALREDRLAREAGAAARLSHPNIVQLHDMGRSEHGPFLVFELLRGEPLEALLARGPLPLRQALHLARDVAAGLGHAHAAGVVHRDLKPANVFVTADGHAKILDFGLARAFGERSVQAGTPAYMAPEQWRGAPEDERTDVFALGVLLYEMLTGELPFPGDTGARDVRFSPVVEVPDAPAVGLLLQRMLARDAVGRPRDAAAVGRELDEAMGAASPASPAPDSPRIYRRSRAWLRLAAVAVASLAAGGTVGALLHARTARKAETGNAARTTVVVGDAVNATDAPSLDGISGLLATTLEQSRALDVVGHRRLVDLAGQMSLAVGGRVNEDAARRMARDLGAKVLLLPEVRRRGGDLVVVVRGIDPVGGETVFAEEERLPASAREDAVPEMVDRLAAAFRQSLREPSGSERSIPVGAAVTRNLDAYRHYLLGLQAANETFDVATALREFRAALEADPEFALPHLELATLAGWHDAPDEDPRAHMRAAARQAPRLPDKERRMVLGYQAHVEKRYGVAARLLDALALDYPLDKQATYMAGEAFWHSGSPSGYARAGAHFRTALDLDPAYLVAYIHLYDWLVRFGSHEEALARAERAAKVRPTPEAQSMVARALAANDRWDDAVEAARNALRVSGGDHSESSYALAEVLASAGRLAEAEAELRRWLRPEFPAGVRRQAIERITVVLAEQGRVREAREIFATVAGAGAGQQYDAWDASHMAHLALAGGGMAAALAALGSWDAPSPGVDVDADRLAWLFTWVGNPAEGRARAAHLPPGSVHERRHAGALALVEGRHEEAIAILGDLARREPAVEPVFLLGLALRGAGRHAEALQAFDTVRGTHLIYTPSSQASMHPWAAVLAAEEMAQLGRAREARAILDALATTQKQADPGMPLVASATALRERTAPR